MTLWLKSCGRFTLIAFCALSACGCPGSDAVDYVTAPADADEPSRMPASPPAAAVSAAGQVEDSQYHAAIVLPEPSSTSLSKLKLTPIATFQHGARDQSAAEIAAYDVTSRRLFVVNVADQAIDVLDIASPETPRKVGRFHDGRLGAPTSVACRDGWIATSFLGRKKSERGVVVFLSANGDERNRLAVDYEPDMLTFAPNGQMLLVANEGEPADDGRFDPPGSVSVIHLGDSPEQLTPASVVRLGFESFDSAPPEHVRIIRPGARLSEDLEPEYIAVAPDSSRAWVACQENNAVAILDLVALRVEAIVGLGLKDHSQPGAGFDASDRDGGVHIRNWPVRGMYQPDGVACFEAEGCLWIATANDGKSRKTDAVNEECRVSDLQLDPLRFPNAAELQRPEQLGRLRTTRASGDLDGDGLHDEIHSYGGRSFAIWTSDMQRVFDSGDQFERVCAERRPEFFNSDHREGNFDDRSDDKGPEPEGIAIGNLDGRTFAFIGLERRGGVMIYDVTDPRAPRFEDFCDFRTFASDDPACGPEGVLWIPAEHSPDGRALLVLSHEVSGTTMLIRVEKRGAKPLLSNAAE